MAYISLGFYANFTNSYIVIIRNINHIHKIEITNAILMMTQWLQSLVDVITKHRVKWEFIMFYTLNLDKDFELDCYYKMSNFEDSFTFRKDIH